MVRMFPPPPPNHAYTDITHTHLLTPHVLSSSNSPCILAMLHTDQRNQKLSSYFFNEINPIEIVLAQAQRIDMSKV